MLISYSQASQRELYTNNKIEETEIKVSLESSKKGIILTV